MTEDVGSAASNAKVASLLNGADEGMLRYDFAGGAGAYNISIVTYDENDGAATLEFMKNNQVLAKHTLNKQRGHGAVASINRVLVTIEDIQLNPGDVTAIRARRDKEEYARIDSVVFTPLETNTANNSNTFGNSNGSGNSGSNTGATANAGNNNTGSNGNTPPTNSGSATNNSNGSATAVSMGDTRPDVGASQCCVLGTQADVSRFLARATFGGSKTDIAGLEGMDAADWLKSELAKPATLLTPTYVERVNNGQQFAFQSTSREMYDQIISANDQLRQRMVFALSQIIVVDDAEETDEVVYYLDIFARNAFGNFKDILREVTYSPRMGRYLTYMGNRKADMSIGREPDENYAREIMQLFSIGLVELNMDGTPRLQNGQTIETYSNDDIVGLSRVFTGLHQKGPQFGLADSDAGLSPMQMFEEEHEQREKTFLGHTIPAGTSGTASIDEALNVIFNHPNVAPFIARGLIQRFTASSPSAAYVERVALAFETGSFVAPNGQTFGTGQRGDMEATIAAILLDRTLYVVDPDAVDPALGKIREPILRFAHWARAFDVSNLDAFNEEQLFDTSDPANFLGQHYLRSPTVFNFYRTTYVAPGTVTGELGLTAPEFQIVNGSTTVGYTNFMADFVQNATIQVDESRDTYRPDYSVELALADDPVALVNHLDVLLTGARMLDESRDAVASALNDLPMRNNNQSEDRLRRVELAIMMVLISPSYTVQR